jgi:hypothetical protein
MSSMESILFLNDFFNDWIPLLILVLKTHEILGWKFVQGSFWTVTSQRACVFGPLKYIFLTNQSSWPSKDKFKLQG